MADGSGRKRRRWRGVMGFLRPAVLFLLLRENAHGYSLLEGLTEFGFNSEQLDPSVIYRALREMEEDGWVESHLGEKSLGPQRRVYQILPEGQDRLSELIDHLRRRQDEISILLQAYDQEVKK
ncbi:MAG: helix-turn-helix transcriptional regulator [Chloroflexota bacterium]